MLGREHFARKTIEHFAHISFVARLLGRENLIAREEVARLQELRGTYGIKAPAPICADPAVGDGPGGTTDASGDATCQVVQAPEGGGQRLVPDAVAPPLFDVTRVQGRELSDDTEIRLTYRELSALIEDAIRSLR